MKSVRLHGTDDLRIQDEPVPVPGAGEKLLRVTSLGICGSDLHWLAQEGIGDEKLARPLVLGHEFAALTAEGERVAVDPAVPCGECELCRNGHPNLCPAVRFAGHNVDGALREYLSWQAACCFPLPDALNDDDGAMLEPLGVAIHAVDLAKLRVGMSVGVFGCGPIGLLILQLARLSGAAKILATDVLPHRVQAARELGASRAYQVDGRLADGQVREATSGRGLDVAFEVSGAQAGVDDAFAAVMPGGKVILAGIPDDDRTAFTASLARRKGLTIKMVRRMKNTYPRAIDLVARGQVDVRSLVTHHFPLSESARAFATAARREGLKVMIRVCKQDGEE